MSYHTRNALKKNKVIRSTSSYSDAKYIGILFSAEDKFKFESIKRFIKDLENDGKDVLVLSYLPKGKENYDFLFDFFTKKDVSFWGHFTSSVVNNFIKQPFDFLFSIDKKSNILLENILATCQSKCRIGWYNNSKKDYFELMINMSEDKPINELIHEMYYFTKKLN